MGLRAKSLVIIGVVVVSIVLAGWEAASPRDLKRQYKEIQEKIRDQKKKLSDVKRIEGLTLDELDRTNRQLNTVERELRKFTRRLRGTEKHIGEVEAEIEELEAKLQRRKEWIRRRLRAMYKYGFTGDAILVLGTSENLAQFLRRWRYLEVLASYERRIVEEYIKDLAAFRNKQKELESLYADLREHRQKVQKSRAGLSLKKKQKATILASVRRERDAYEKMLQELKQSSAELLKIIKESERTRYAGKGFRELKGRLPWPVRGRVAIPYGTQKDLRFDTPIFRNGIYIEAAEGSLAKAVHTGRVVFAEWFKGYGQLVIVNHGDGYHSLYANLSEIFLKSGDIIDNNSDVGRVGQSSTFNKSALYFEIRYKGKPLDPTQWLKGR